MCWTDEQFIWSKSDHFQLRSFNICGEYTCDVVTSVLIMWHKLAQKAFFL